MKPPRRTVLRALPSALLFPLAGCQVLNRSSTDNDGTMGGHVLSGSLVEAAPEGAEISHIQSESDTPGSLLMDVIKGAIEQSEYAVSVPDDEISAVRETLSGLEYYRSETFGESGYYVEERSKIVHIRLHEYH